MTIQFESAYARILSIASCRTQVELAEVLGIRQSSVSDAKKRGTVPAEWMLTLLQRFGVNPNWVLTGKGTQFLEPTEKQPTTKIQRAAVAVTMICPFMVNHVRNTPEGPKYSYYYCCAQECMAWCPVRPDMGYCGRE